MTLAYFARIVERMFFREAVDESTDGETASTDALVADGEGTDDEPEPPLVSLGMRTTVLLAAVLAIVLGIAAFEYGQLLQPTIERLLA